MNADERYMARNSCAVLAIDANDIGFQFGAEGSSCNLICVFKAGDAYTVRYRDKSGKDEMIGGRFEKEEDAYQACEDWLTQRALKRVYALPDEEKQTAGLRLNAYARMIHAINDFYGWAQRNPLKLHMYMPRPVLQRKPKDVAGTCGYDNDLFWYRSPKQKGISLSHYELKFTDGRISSNDDSFNDTHLKAMATVFQCMRKTALDAMRKELKDIVNAGPTTEETAESLKNMLFPFPSVISWPVLKDLDGRICVAFAISEHPRLHMTVNRPKYEADVDISTGSLIRVSQLDTQEGMIILKREISDEYQNWIALKFHLHFDYIREKFLQDGGIVPKELYKGYIKGILQYVPKENYEVYRQMSIPVDDDISCQYDAIHIFDVFDTVLTFDLDKINKDLKERSIQPLTREELDNIEAEYRNYQKMISEAGGDPDKYPHGFTDSNEGKKHMPFPDSTIVRLGAAEEIRRDIFAV